MAKKGSGTKRKLAEKDEPAAAESSESKGEQRPKEEAQSEGKSEISDGDQPPTPKSRKTTKSSPLEWLLSDEAFQLANPPIEHGKGEIDLPPSQQGKAAPSEDAVKRSDLSSDDGEESKPEPDSKEGVEEILQYPSSHLTPFQNLICACILSKPLSHRLGMRTIHTLLNPPFGLRTLHDLDEAGYEGRRKVMWEARTQHKEKTAGQLGDVIEGVKELCGDDAGEEGLNSLKGVKEMLKGKPSAEAQDTVVKHLTKIKGIGPGVASIFLRRIQADWEEVYPYADDRCLADARRFGLIGEGAGAEELSKVVDGDRAQYVKLLDNLIGIELEKKMDEALKLAGVSS